MFLSLTLLFCLTTVSAAASGDTIYVNGSGDDSWNGQSAAWDGTSGPKKSIKSATGVVNTNGTIHIANGQYTGENNTNITIDKNMNIIGESQSGTIINGTGTNWIFHIYPSINLTITNLTLTNATAGLTDMYGHVYLGGAIYNGGTLSVNGCTFTGNNADYGGVIYNEGIINSVSGCTFTGNTAKYYGGAIYNGGTLSVNGCTFTGNTVISGDGGAILNVGTINSLNGCTFTGNTAVNGGVINNVGTISLSGCNFTDNTATSGGAIWNGYYYLSDSKVTLVGCNITQNTATTYGGAIYNEGSLTANYNRFYNNTATDGTTIYSSRGSVNANYNWWSSNKDPKSIDKLIYDPGNLVNTTNWVILSVNATPATINNTQSAIVTADLNHYTNSTGYVGELTQHIPEGTIKLSIPWGSFLYSGMTRPIIVDTLNGVANAVFYAKKKAAPLNPVKITATADNYVTNDTESAYVTINKTSKLYIKTTSNSKNPKVGENFLLTYKLGNYGPDAADNVTVTFQIPKGLEFANINADTGKYTYNKTTRTITWTIDSVPVGDPYLYLTVKAADSGTYTITPNIITTTYNLNSSDAGVITLNIEPNNSSNGNGTQPNKINPDNGINTNTVNAASKITKTVGLQDTGLPLNYLLLAVLMVLGGLIPKRK